MTRPGFLAVTVSSEQRDKTLFQIPNAFQASDLNAERNKTTK